MLAVDLPDDNQVIGVGRVPGYAWSFTTGRKHDVVREGCGF
jgi:hypothetical protein